MARRRSSGFDSADFEAAAAGKQRIRREMTERWPRRMCGAVTATEMLQISGNAAAANRLRFGRFRGMLRRIQRWLG